MEALGLRPVVIEIGEVEIEEKLTFKKYDALKEALAEDDFELIIAKEIITLEKIKLLVIEMIHYSVELPNINYSDYISKKLRISYTYLSKLFSKREGITLEHFIIAHKIERTKRLLVYNEFTLSEIAWKLHYSSTAHLSAQFKKVTGLTPSVFKKLQHKNLIPLGSV